MEPKRITLSSVISTALLAVVLIVIGACNPFNSASINYLPGGNSLVLWPEDFGSPSLPSKDPSPSGSTNTMLTVGVLLPITGKHTAVGSEMRQAAFMAIEDVAVSGIRFGIVDTASTQQGAESATKTALNAGADLILGPLLSDSVRQAATLASSRGVSVIGYTNDITKAQPGVFPLGLAPQQSVNAMIKWAADNNYKRVAIMAPETAYGKAAQAAASRVAARYGIRITEQASYGQDDVSKNIKAQELAAQKDNFDAILIPDAGNALREVASLLYFHEVDPEEKKYMGLEGWDDPNLVTEQSLIGGLYAAPPSEDLDLFEQRYQHRYGSKPSIQAAAVYDSIMLAGELGHSQNYGRFSNSGNPFTVQNLTRSRGFKGLLGNYRLTRTGHVERLFDIKQINNDGVAVLQPAESDFGMFSLWGG